MSRKTVSEEQKKKFVELYNEGYPISDIIKIIGQPLTSKNFYYFLKRDNISIDRDSRTNHNIAGKQFGYLTVLKMVRSKSTKNHSWRAICQCSNCGNQNFSVDPQSLRRGQTSCGCRKDQYITGKNNKNYIGYEELNGTFWGKVKIGAQKRGFIVNIDIKYAWNLYLKQNKKCALSGLPIEFATSSRKNNEGTASLDRIDSTKGYIEGNVQWVHKHINSMKNVYEQDYFISLCKSIAEKNNEQTNSIS